VPENFKFSVKVPNSITLTHYYSKTKNIPLEKNPHFFSNQIFDEFLEILSPMHKKLGPIMFQFEYLNKHKMSNQQVFMDKLETFISGCPKDYEYAIEIRNPNYLNKDYFGFLESHSLSHVFLQGYYMPSIFDLFQKYKRFVRDLTIIRLHGPNRKNIEKVTQKKWNEVVAPKDSELSDVFQMVKELMENEIEVYVNVNNHYEGSAPLTIEKILANIQRKQNP
jgi:uncharacterized protein YecE (DUF72 family)